MDSKNPLSTPSRTVKKLIIITQFIMAIIILNYSSMSSQSITDVMINQNYLNNQTNKPEIFHSINALLCIEKGITFLLSWLIIRCLDNSQQQTITYQQASQTACIGDGGYRQATSNNNSFGSNKKRAFKLSTAQSAILGALTFIAFQVFMRLQSSLNVIFMLISKYVNFFFIFIFYHYTMPSRPTSSSVFTRSHVKTILKDFCYSLPVIIGVILAKANFSQLPSMYRSNSGMSPVQKMSLTDFFVWALAFLVDYLLYGWIKKVKLDNYVEQKSTIIVGGMIDYRNPLILLNSWTKYTAIFFLVYITATGELFYMVSFIMRHHKIIVYLIKVSLYHCISQYIVCHIILTYRLHVFFCMIVTIGASSKLHFYTFQDFNLGGIPYFSVLTGFGFMLSQVISEKLEKENSFSQDQTREEIKVYGSVEFDEKEEESRQQDIEGDDQGHSPMTIAHK